MRREDFEPCRDCKKRYRACQDYCPEHAKARKLWAAVRARERADGQYLGHVKDVVIRIKTDRYRRKK